MTVVFQPGQQLGRTDLDVFFTDSNSNPTNVAEITYAIYYVDPGPPEAEVLIGSATRVPVNPAVGEYYAALAVPSGAAIGDYIIRWTLKEFSNSPAQQAVQEWAVVLASTIIAPSTYTAVEQECIRSLRILLRDHCVGGEELVEFDVDGELMTVSMEDLYEAIHG